MIEHADSRFQFKSIEQSGLIEGLAAGIGDVDRGGDTILPGAFARTLAARGTTPPPMLREHDPRLAIGSWTEWREVPEGLELKGRLTMETRDAQEAYALARDGGLPGLSIGYVAKGPRYVPGGRDLPDLDLHEASLVAVPMHPRTRTTSVKSIGGAGDIADLFRERGLSGRQAKAAAGAARRAIHDHSDEAAADAELAALFSDSAARLAIL